MAMNPMGIGIVYSRRCQRGPNVRDILPERGKFGRAYEFDRNDLSDRYLQKFGNSVLSMVYHHSTLPVRLRERWNLENRPYRKFRRPRLTDAQLMKCALSLRPKLWS